MGINGDNEVVMEVGVNGDFGCVGGVERGVDVVIEKMGGSGNGEEIMGGREGWFGVVSRGVGRSWGSWRICGRWGGG